MTEARIRALADELYGGDEYGYDSHDERLFALLVDVADLYRHEVGDTGIDPRQGGTLIGLAENLEMRDEDLPSNDAMRVSFGDAADR